ncbi:MAG: MerC domain-containing protein [Myxococcales bacterium]
MNVQLLSFSGCPNAAPAREALRRALTALGRPARFAEVDLLTPETPEVLRSWPSPTILVDGAELFGAPAASGSGCQLYAGGAPSEAALREALERALGGRPTLWQSLALLPAALLAVLPHLTCPACWPAYAALLSALGLPFVASDRLLTPLLAAALLLGCASIAWSTRSHRNPGPLALTLLASIAVAAGRLVWDLPPLLYGGTIVLVGAALWNLRLRRPRQGGVDPGALRARGVGQP